MNQPKKIENPKTPIPQTPEMNDRDFLNDMLATEKYMAASYSVALNEASHQAYFQDLLSILNETHECQRDLFKTMFQLGWYSLEAENPQKLNQEYQHYQGYQSQFPYNSPQIQ